jgi:hypothetical protein
MAWSEGAEPERGLEPLAGSFRRRAACARGPPAKSHLTDERNAESHPLRLRVVRLPADLDIATVEAIRDSVIDAVDDAYRSGPRP